MKLWKRILSCFLALLLTVYLLPVQVMAEELGDLWPLTTENIAETPPDVIGEVLERRGENQKEFLLANGVRQVVIYPAAVHYQKDGQWEDIDNRLLPAATRDGETVYQNAAGMWDVSVPAELNTAGGITVSRNGYSLSFYLTGQLFEDGGAISESGSASMGEELSGEDMICVPAGESTAAISSTTSTLADDDQLQPEAALKNQRSEALYQNVYHDTDVTYDLDSNRLKESLILRSCPKEMLGYRYRLETDSLRLELQEDNRILAYAKDAGLQDEPVFYMPAPYLLDAENAYSNDIKVTLEENDKGYELRYYLPQDWMADAAYPVVMDPVVQPVSNTFTIRDKTVTQRNPPAYDAISLDAGYSTNRGRERIYIRFKNIPSLTSADVVVGAKVLLYKYSGSGSISGNYMTAHQVKSMWDSETITWANRADYVHTSEDYQFVAGQTWHSWDITNIAQKWYEPSGNTGVMLRMSEAVEGGTTTKTASFYSSDYSNTQQCPMLVISYINNCGLESTWDYTSSSAGRAGTGYVNDYTGNLVWVHTGLGFSGNRMPVSINAVYNANDKGNKAYGLGYGWRTNYNQRVEQITLGGTTYYRWEDEDGTRHYFMKKSTHNRRERPVHGHRGGSRGRFYYRITTFEGRPWDARDPYKTTFMALKHEIRLSIWRKQKETPGVEKAPGVSSPQRKESGRSGRDDGELRFWVRPGHPYKAVTSISQAEALAHGLTHLHHLVFAAVLARELDWCAALQDAREDARPWGVVGIGLRSDVWVEVRRDDHRPAVLVTRVDDVVDMPHDVIGAAVRPQVVDDEEVILEEARLRLLALVERHRLDVGHDVLHAGLQRGEPEVDDPVGDCRGIERLTCAHLSPEEQPIHVIA